MLLMMPPLFSPRCRLLIFAAYAAADMLDTMLPRHAADARADTRHAFAALCHMRYVTLRRMRCHDAHWPYAALCHATIFSLR